MPDHQAGRVGRCPRCKSKVIVPPATRAQNKPALSDLLDVSAPAQAARLENEPDEVATSGANRDQPTSLAADPLAEVIEESRFPWFLDTLAYPVSSSGAVNIAVFVIAPQLVAFVVSLLTRFIQSALPLGGAGYLTTLLTAPFYIAFACYVCYYIAHCVTDSSRGHRRASDIQIAGALSFGDLLSQTILLVASVAIACWPVAAYYVLTERTDAWYWLLGACGVFFLPMSFLAGVIFDSFDALNPLLIVRSIWRTLVPYCGLVLFFLAITGLATVVIRRLPLWPFLRTATQIYLLLVLANSIGRFYWRYRERLDWGL
jgi:hypothetical protein